MSDPQSEPQQVVLGFLEAVASGDADVARTLMNRIPSDSPWLTSEVLSRSLSAHPITNIIAEPCESTDGRHCAVAASYTIDGQVARVDLPVLNSDGKWWVALARVGTSSFGDCAGVDLLSCQIDGLEVGFRSTVALFPGFHQITSSNPLIVIENGEFYFAGDKELRTSMIGVARLRPDVDTSVRTTLLAKVESCLDSYVGGTTIFELDYPGCSFLRASFIQGLDVPMEWSYTDGSDPKAVPLMVTRVNRDNQLIRDKSVTVVPGEGVSVDVKLSRSREAEGNPSTKTVKLRGASITVRGLMDIDIEDIW